MVSATLVLAQVGAEGQASVGATLVVLDAPWSEADTSWSNRPDGLRTTISYLPDTLGPVTWDATGVVTAWLGGIPNNGLRLSACGDRASRGAAGRSPAARRPAAPRRPR